jgi:hypothetical protein
VSATTPVSALCLTLTASWSAARSGNPFPPAVISDDREAPLAMRISKPRNDGLANKNEGFPRAVMRSPLSLAVKLVAKVWALQVPARLSELVMEKASSTA